VSRKEILIVGESLLVDEYAELCTREGFAVGVRGNAAPKAKTRKGGTRVSRISKSFDIALELTNIDLATKRKNLAELDKILPPRTPIISSSTTVMLAQQTTWVKHPERLVGIGALPTLLQGKLVEFATSDQTDEQSKHAAREFASSLGKESAFVVDTPGLVMPRILCMIINEACFAMMEGVAEGKDIDTAMRLGTSYPTGPVEWAERIGWHHVLAVLDGLQALFGDDRYRAAPLLRRLALKHQHSAM
jgi:3-hydroxybutyryl-CoA dehydrogenase